MSLYGGPTSWDRALRLLYISPSNNIHDERFITAWRESGFNVSQLTASSSFSENPSSLLREIEAAKPDIIQVGPISKLSHQVGTCWTGPLIVTSWGFDLMLDLPRRTLSRTVAETTLLRADSLFLDNNATRDKAIELGVDSQTIRQFPWGLDPFWFQAKTVEHHSSSGSFVLSTRNHEPIYRVNDLLHAFVRSHIGQLGFELWLAGSGSLTNELKREVHRLSLDGQVRFLGRQNATELQKLYSSAAIYVSTSETDGTSISLLEAMASGAPVVVSDIPGNKQWVTDRTGWKFTLGDIDALAYLLQSLSKPDNTLAETINRRISLARKEVKNNANWCSTVRQFPIFANQASLHAKERLKL